MDPDASLAAAAVAAVPRRVARENIKELLAKKRETLLVQVCVCWVLSSSIASQMACRLLHVRHGDRQKLSLAVVVDGVLGPLRTGPNVKP